MEINEVLNLIVDIISLLFLFIARSRRHKRYNLFLSGILCIIASHLMSIAESFFLPILLNVLEHTLLLASIILFMLSIYRYFYKQEDRV